MTTCQILKGGKKDYRDNASIAEIYYLKKKKKAETGKRSTIPKYSSTGGGFDQGLVGGSREYFK